MQYNVNYVPSILNVQALYVEFSLQNYILHLEINNKKTQTIQKHCYLYYSYIAIQHTQNVYSQGHTIYKYILYSNCINLKLRSNYMYA